MGTEVWITLIVGENNRFYSWTYVTMLIFKVQPVTCSGNSVTSYKGHVVSYNWDLNRLFNILFGLGTKKISKPRITGPLWGESIADRYIHLTWDSNAESVSMSLRYHVMALTQVNKDINIFEWILLRIQMIFSYISCQVQIWNSCECKFCVKFKRHEFHDLIILMQNLWEYLMHSTLNTKFLFTFSELHLISLWHHQMETFSALLALCDGNPPVTGEVLSKRLVTRSIDVLMSDPRLNKRLSKQSRRRWFEMTSRSLWSHCNVLWIMTNIFKISGLPWNSLEYCMKYNPIY